MMIQQITGGLAVALSASGNIYYLRQVLLRRTKPHFFSWLIWGLLGFIGGAAQIAGGAGPGAWVVISAGCFCLLIAAAGFFIHGERHITRGDWVALLFALTAIPVWLVTQEPLFAAVIATLIDLSGFYPTLRKSWHAPHDENAAAFAVYTLTMFLSVISAQTVSATTVLYPAAISAANACVVIILLSRRRTLA